MTLGQEAELRVAAERDKRDSQRDAVLRLMMPLTTAFPSALSTLRSCVEAASASFVAIACRADLISDRSFDLVSTFRARRFKPCRCLLITDGWTANKILLGKLFCFYHVPPD